MNSIVKFGTWLIGAGMWVLFPLLAVNLVLIPWSNYGGMSTVEIVSLGCMFFGSFLILEYLTRLKARQYRVHETLTLGPAAVEVFAANTTALNIGTILYIPLFLALSWVVGWVLYQKYLTIFNGHIVLDGSIFLIIDCYAVFIAGTNIFARLWRNA